MMSLIVRSLTLMVYFYTNLFYITPVVLKKRGVVVFAITTLILIVAISLINSSFHQFYVEGRGGPPPMPEHWRPDGPGHFGPPPDGPPMMFASPTFSSLLITSLVAIISSMLVFWQEWNKVQAEKQEQALQRIAAELTALKLQISPHFLFNTLNNIRWLVRSKSEMAEDAVVKLSHLLRYILYQTDKEKVDLEGELDHLRDFIELQKMRIENPEAVEFLMEGDFTNKQIVPLLLLPLVENFFKHGDFSGAFRNRISLGINGIALIFKSENRIDKFTEKEKGIGLQNVIKRLNLHYPNQYLLHYFEKDSVFFIQLELILSGNMI
ncbi:MAG: histidine kinase [Bacteroidetes bacterium]|nr:histidine kinase [Bacteroidota bacterium]